MRKVRRHLLAINLDTFKKIKFESIYQCGRALKLNFGRISQILDNKGDTAVGYFGRKPYTFTFELLGETAFKFGARLRPITGKELKTGKTKKFVSIKAASRYLGIDSGNICGVLAGRGKTAKGWTFVYSN